MKTKFLCLIFSFIISSTYAQDFSPYYFSADISKYPDLIAGETVKYYVNWDYLSEHTQFIDNESYTPAHRKALIDNMGIENIPNSVYVQFGFVTKSENMRMSPSFSTLHKGDPKFDMNQYTRIGASYAVAVLHTSADGKFYFVQSEFMRGWLPQNAVAIYDLALFRHLVQLPFLRVMADRVNIAGVDYSIGDKIHLIDEGVFGYDLWLPDDRIEFEFKNSKLTRGNLNFSEKIMDRLIRLQIGNPYDWGGKAGYRDCSSFVRDLWLVFGLDLPRNTSMQSKIGKELLAKPKSKEEFYSTLHKAKPYKTLIFFKGHVILYAGMDNGDYIIFHSVNRLADDNGVVHQLSAVVSQRLLQDQFSDIWKRVVKVTELE